MRERCARWRQPGRTGKGTGDPCVPIREPAFHRPDPLIYSQGELMKLGLAVTWDNPDVFLFRNGAPVPSSSLDPGTEYEIVARIWNNSTSAPIVALPVGFSFLGFGVATQSQPIAQTVVDLGVKGGPNHPAFARVKWRTPSTPGHYCIQVLLDPVDDLNFDNNLGQENTEVQALQSPAHFTFALRNDRETEQTFRFEVDSYAIPALVPCGEVGDDDRGGPRGAARRRARLLARHDRAAYPLPAGWSVQIDPGEPRLAPDAEIAVGVTVTAPPGFTGRQPLNINAFNERGFAGGVTAYIEGHA